MSHYDLLEILDRGETAFLYKARDRRDGSLVAVEVFSPDVTPEEVREHRRGGAVGQAPDGRFFVVRALEGGDSDATVLEIPRGFSSERRPADLDFLAHPAGRTGGRVAHYRLLGQLGRGGMGVVYRAEDTRLRRTVALKFLPSGLTRDLVAKARFLQEAQAASALDHANICTIYEVGEAGDGELYLAMAFYDGETVRSKLDRGPLPVSEAVDLARQVAQGLAKAHRNGIVHRDIKPANLMVTSDGVVKILDFGIAKLLESDLSLAGSFAGTPAYMSPEQARGEEVDARADVWALGVVLYEMLTGVRPSQGEETRPSSQLRAGIPSEIDRILDVMLANSEAERYPTAAEVLADLRALQDALSAAGSTRRTLLWAVAAALVAGALATGVWLSRREETPIQGVVKRLTSQEGLEEYPSLSPDGSSLVYVRTTDGQRDLYWQRVDGGDAKLLTPGSPLDDTQPAFSPDGQWIAFRSERDGGGIYLIALSGGSMRRITDSGYNPAWSPNGKEITVATEGIIDPTRRNLKSQIYRVDVETGRKHSIVAIDGVQPSWSPGGGRIAFWGLSPDRNRRILWTVPAEGGEPVSALDDGYMNWNPVWSPDGTHLYFGSDRNGSFNLWRIRIDERSGTVQGGPQPVTASSQVIGFWSFSRDGRQIAYAANDSRSNLQRYPFDPENVAVTGTAISITRGSNAVRSCDASPDGQRIAFHTSFPQEDIFVVRVNGEDLRQLTRDRYRDRHPFWSPDGRKLLFYSNRRSINEPWIIQADGRRLQPVVKRRSNSLTFPIWSPGGDRVACCLSGSETVIVDLKQGLEERSLKPLVSASTIGETFCPTSWSADGERLAGNMARLDDSVLGGIGLFSFRTESYERLTMDGSDPIWLRDGRRLLYRENNTITTIDTKSKEIRRLLSAPPHSEFGVVCLSFDEHELFVTQSINEGDIWIFKANG